MSLWKTTVRFQAIVLFHTVSGFQVEVLSKVSLVMIVRFQAIVRQNNRDNNNGFVYKENLEEPQWISITAIQIRISIYC